MEVLNRFGKPLDFVAVVQFMDSEIAERLNAELAPCAPQYFYEAYCTEHYKKFGEVFFTEEGENIAW